MEVQILSQKFIKPYSQTPLHLRNMKVSLIDQLAPPAYTPMILYYSAVNGEKTMSERDNRFNRLEKSLSETLACYYPLAGRYIEDRNMVDCNDDGALFLEAKVSGQLAQLDLQGAVDVKSLNRFVPFGDEMAFNPIVLAVQINKFDCGGLVIGVCISHRVADGHTMGAFLKAWATACRAGMHEVIRPSFDAGALFPARDVLRFGTPVPRDHGSQIVTKRFVFDGEKISSLKAKVMSYARDSDVKRPPSRVEVVTALLWKALIGVAQAKHGKLRPSLLTLPLNLRGKVDLLITENSFGNLYRMVGVRFNPKESSSEMHHLVSLLNDAVNKANKDCEKVVNSDDVIAMVSKSMEEIHNGARNGDLDICVVPSWCKFPFYQIDFGFGKPTWFSSVHKPLEIVLLVDTKFGTGIEAWDFMCLDAREEFKVEAFTIESEGLYHTALAVAMEEI
ncbi:stemmadenine O-acetyltransferase-like [Populus nigra]|uniref:stemmadenine O-acetyltransferase-like n=1 Tax=Populus nigra TaxID=3691 RepID=UPI002B274895|nr:stemmadenine O-acetyltransferase-like [Populus nigra]